MGFEFSKYQKDVFDFVENKTGNAAVNAVAGSGKSTTLIEVGKRSKSDNSLFIAFNKHIVDEINKKLKGSGSRMKAKTAHSFGFGSISKAFPGAKVQINRFKYSNLINDYLEDKRLLKYDKHFKGALRQMCNLVRMTFTSPKCQNSLEDLMEHYGVFVEKRHKARLFEAVELMIQYGDADAENNAVIDFTDMIYLPIIWDLDVPKVDFLCCDEAQDFNSAQLELLLKAGHKNTRFIFVGDPRQAIMGFAGADANSFQNIIDRCDATELPLSICYRCPKSHIRIAKAIVPQIEAFEGNEEGVVSDISPSEIIKAVKTGDMLLSRKTAPLIAQCIKFIGQKIPAKVRGRDIGKSLTKIVREVSKMPNYSYQNFEFALNDYQEQKIAKMMEKEKTQDQVEAFSDKVLAVRTCYDNFDSRDAGELSEEIESLFSDENESITLSTAHRAKGLEADRVFHIAPEDFPLTWNGQKEWQYKQELNLKYVALTRAKKRIVFCKVGRF